jgi:hypothetical protein
MEKPMPHRAETVAQLVAAFGGTGKLAEWLDVVPSTVSNWKEQNSIPTGWHLRLYLECEKRGISFAPKIFRLKEEDHPRPLSATSDRRTRSSAHA